MRYWKKIPLIIRGIEVMLLAAAVIAAVSLMPGTGRGPETGGEAQSAAAAGEAGENAGAEGSVEKGSGAESSGEKDAGAAGSSGEKNVGAAGSSGENSSGAVGSSGTEKGGETALKKKDSGGKKRPAADKSGDTASGGEAKETIDPQEAAGPPTLFLATDLHYQWPEMTDYRAALDNFTAWNDGTVVPYLNAIADAFLEEVLQARPEALILSGDISQNGEKENHLALAEKLRRVQEAGIPVLVIPGNHDINHPWSGKYFDDRVEPAEGTTPEDFYEIYRAFGYDGASSRDPASLSYLYRLDEDYWIMMLDSCIYEPQQQTGGRIKAETLEWMRGQLEEAAACGALVIPVAHHNLLKESTLYPEECTLENGPEVTALLEEFGLPVYLSGHLHLQRVKKHDAGPADADAYGIWEIVTSPLSMSPCQYSIMEWQEDGSLSYRTKKVDVEDWARRYGEEDENLLHFSEYADAFLVRTVANQAFLGLELIPEDRKYQMAELYGRLNRDYCSGKRISAAEVKKSETYLYWERHAGTGAWADRLQAILQDTKRDHTSLELTAGVDFPAR